MRIVENSGDHLVCQEKAWRVGALLVIIALFLAGYSWLGPDRRWEPAVPIAFLLFMAWLATYGAKLHIDRRTGVIEMEVRRLGRRRSQEVAIAEVAQVVVRRATGQSVTGDSGVLLLTLDGRRYPLLPAYTATRTAQYELRNLVREFLGIVDN